MLRGHQHSTATSPLTPKEITRMLHFLCISLLALLPALTPAHAVEIPLNTLPPVQLTANEESEVDAMVLPVPPAWVGDLEGMRANGTLRILVPPSKTFFMLDRGKQSGMVYEYGKALEKWLDKNYPLAQKKQRWQVMFIPTARNELLPKLLAGLGDVAAGGLTVTPGRLQTVDFAIPGATDVHEVLVGAPGSPTLHKLEDLSGKEVTVRASSSYFEHLVTLNQTFKTQGLAPIKIIPANENLETEDLLQMVNAGIFNFTVADRYIAKLWLPLYSELKIHETFFLSEGGQIGWAYRKGSPQLQKALDAFGHSHRIGSEFGNIMLRRFMKDTQRIKNPTSAAEMKKFNALVGLFNKHADTYDFDYLMLMAQGFQESQLDQRARSHMGAVGVMQLLPSTAAEMGFRDVAKNVDQNIEAGSKYLRLLNDTYLNDAEISPVNRTLMSFAAYNAGPGNLRKFRRLAEKSGLDPNIWFGNVEQSAARVVGRETVDYVDNIYKYYVVYKLAADKNRERERALQE
jgi:membrane-bound lytic murein transglycosylase MltF